MKKRVLTVELSGSWPVWYLLRQERVLRNILNMAAGVGQGAPVNPLTTWTGIVFYINKLKANHILCHITTCFMHSHALSIFLFYFIYVFV